MNLFNRMRDALLAAQVADNYHEMIIAGKAKKNLDIISKHLDAEKQANAMRRALVLEFELIAFSRRASAPEVVDTFGCPRCRQVPGVGCRRPDGKKYYQVHMERYALASPAIQERAYQYLGLS